MTSAPHGAQRYASAFWTVWLHRKSAILSEPPRSLPAACMVLPRTPLAALLEGAVFTQPRGPQNLMNNAVRNRFTMRVLPQPPPPIKSIRRILPTGSMCVGLPCFSQAVCICCAMSATGPCWSRFSVAASTRCFPTLSGPKVDKSVGMLCSSSAASSVRRWASACAASCSHIKSGTSSSCCCRMFSAFSFWWCNASCMSTPIALFGCSWTSNAFMASSSSLLKIAATRCISACMSFGRPTCPAVSRSSVLANTRMIIADDN